MWKGFPPPRKSQTPSALKRNEDLSPFSGNNIDPEGAKHLAAGLAKNATLQTIVLACMPAEGVTSAMQAFDFSLADSSIETTVGLSLGVQN